jgi:hypothetical protein
MSAADLERALDALILSCRLPAQPDEQTREDLASVEFYDFADAVGAATEAQKAAAVARIAAVLPDAMPFGGARLAVYCGTVAEGGADAAVTADGVVRQFRRQLALVLDAIGRAAASADRPHPADLADLPSTRPEEAEAVRALAFVAQSVVSHLARLPDLRAALAADAGLLEQLDAASAHVVGAEWVQAVLSFRDGDVLVLHPESGRGFFVGYRNLANAFHLFTLIQGLLGPELGVDLGDRADVLAMARGQSPISSGAWDTAAWGFCHHFADPAGGGFIMNWVRGETSPADIPAVDGTAVLLLLPATASRSWHAGFFAPAVEQFPPSAEILAVLSPEEAGAWLACLARLRAEAAARVATTG